MSWKGKWEKERKRDGEKKGERERKSEKQLFLRKKKLRLETSQVLKPTDRLGCKVKNDKNTTKKTSFGEKNKIKRKRK